MILDQELLQGHLGVAGSSLIMAERAEPLAVWFYSMNSWKLSQKSIFDPANESVSYLHHLRNLFLFKLAIMDSNICN